LRTLIIALFIAGAVGDIVTTMMCYFKAPFDNESSPIHFGNIYVSMMIKVIIYAIATYVLASYYKSIPYEVLRYFYVYAIIFACLLQIGAIFNNLSYFNTPNEQLRQATDEELSQAYSSFVLGMEGMKPKSTPVLLVVLPLNLFQFISWRSFESWRKRLLQIEEESRQQRCSLEYA